MNHPYDDDYEMPPDLIAEHMHRLEHGVPNEPHHRPLRTPWDRGPSRAQVEAFKHRAAGRLGKSKPVQRNPRARQERRAARLKPATPPGDATSPPPPETPDPGFSPEKYAAVADALADLIIAAIERRTATLAHIKERNE